MFGHGDDRSQQNDKPMSDNGMLTNDDNKNLDALVGGDATNYSATGLQLPASAPAPTSAPAPATPPPVIPASLDDASTPVSAPADTPADTTTAVTTPTLPAATPHPDELLDIKQQALQHLSPLVDHLEQSPSDRFRTTMMMIQASDNAALIKDAYDAAVQITDDKERAQALLDLINEINYFTQNSATASGPKES